MSEIKRYDNGYDDSWCHDGLVGCKRDENGRLVKYEDCLELAVQLANAESKCMELTAESSRVKLVASNLVSEYISNKGTDCEFISCITPSKNTIGTGGVWDMWRLLDLVLQETPSTDAFLAEVRARAVDEACLKISNAIINCYQDEQVGLDAAATICGDFSAQLRKGAAL